MTVVRSQGDGIASFWGVPHTNYSQFIIFLSRIKCLFRSRRDSRIQTMCTSLKMLRMENIAARWSLIHLTWFMLFSSVCENLRNEAHWVWGWKWSPRITKSKHPLHKHFCSRVQSYVNPDIPYIFGGDGFSNFCSQFQTYQNPKSNVFFCFFLGGGGYWGFQLFSDKSG